MRFKILFLCALFCFVVANANSQETSQWHGPNRDGIYPGNNLLEKWPANGPKLLWKYDKLGVGYASAAITSDRVYTIGTKNNISYVFCFDHNGELIYETKLGPDWSGDYPGIRGTPTILGDKGYILNGTGVLYCFNPRNGETIWKRSVRAEFNGNYDQFGVAESVVVDGNKVFCTTGGKDVNVVALNRMNGEIIWKCKGNSEATVYSSPIVITHGNKKFLITTTKNSLLSIDVESGQLVWRYPLQEEFNQTTPLYKDGVLFVCGVNKSKSSAIRISDDGRSYDELWRLNAIGQALILDNMIFYAWDQKLHCHDWKTGKKQFSINANDYETAIIAADDHIYLLTRTGTMNLFKPNGNSFDNVGSFKLPKQKENFDAHQVIHDGRLYVRNNNNLLVYQIN